MKYIDSNFFIYATASDTPEGHWCRKILGHIMEGEFIACTSTLTWDEIVYVLMKKINREIALECSEYFLSLPNVHYIDVSPEILKSAHFIMTQYAIKPRDAIHAAWMSHQGIDTMITEDTHFDRIPSVKRVWINDIP
ncbi:type II toxin-antitoxin system VapC family toxin [Methanospirillum hungatei]|uniref:type II toxin-antitoxin system VapC family toxin n=1 Tax=Methanospirillum hungatei TaxID=2203 RepID=UPI0026F1A5FE|nr:type II toxin-antitoxin system VapC family toxin [Methanospirillum hungatei]MCA1917078.1 type II toxin-antitoxin system VapC family toxin [Methanospirillum hungatei]